MPYGRLQQLMDKFFAFTAGDSCAVPFNEAQDRCSGRIGPDTKLWGIHSSMQPGPSLAEQSLIHLVTIECRIKIVGNSNRHDQNERWCAEQRLRGCFVLKHLANPQPWPSPLWGVLQSQWHDSSPPLQELVEPISGHSPSRSRSLSGVGLPRDMSPRLPPMGRAKLACDHHHRTSRSGSKPLLVLPPRIRLNDRWTPGIPGDGKAPAPRPAGLIHQGWID